MPTDNLRAALDRLRENYERPMDGSFATLSRTMVAVHSDIRAVLEAARAASPEPTEDTIERMAEAREVVRRFMLYLDEWGYESHGALAREFGPVEFEGSSQSTEAWLDRVLRDPARAALAAEHGCK